MADSVKKMDMGNVQLYATAGRGNVHIDIENDRNITLRRGSGGWVHRAGAEKEYRTRKFQQCVFFLWWRKNADGIRSKKIGSSGNRESIFGF